MNEPKKRIDPIVFVILGCILLGLGVGFFFFPHWIFDFLGCLMIGTSVGFLIAAVLSYRAKGE